MAIKAEDITAAKLPTAMRGYQREATEELLNAIAWEFRQLVRARDTTGEATKRLEERVRELEGETEALRHVFAQEQAQLKERGEQLVAERTAELEAQLAAARRAVADLERREELTQSLLANAQRTARELRESTRSECKAVLKAARRRAIVIEREARVSVRQSAGELDRLQRLENDLRDRLRRTLQSVIEPAPPAQPLRPDEEPQPPALH